MKQNEDGKTVRAMDVLFPKIGEIIGGSEREADYDKLMTRIQELGIPMKDMLSLIHIYPLQKKGHTMEFLREIAHLRPRTNTFGAVFRLSLIHIFCLICPRHSINQCCTIFFLWLL